MSNRFGKRKSNRTGFKEILLPLIVFALIGALFYFGVGSIGETSETERLRSMEQAITRAAVQCYAVEGRYPPSLSYLEENYGVLLDYDNYIIQYDIFATNIMPTILVLSKDFQQGQMEVVIR